MVLWAVLAAKNALRCQQTSVGVAELEGWCPSNDFVALVKNYFIKSYLQDFHQHKTNVLLHSLKVRLYDNHKGSVSFCFRNAVVAVILCTDWKILLQINLFRVICRVCKLSRKASKRRKDIWTHARQCFEKFIWGVAINCHRFNGEKC